MSSREERIGLNEAVFREVNERIEDLAETFDLKTQSLDLICECGDAACVERITMTRSRVRGAPLGGASVRRPFGSRVSGRRERRRQAEGLRHRAEEQRRSEADRRADRSATADGRIVVAALGDSITEGSPGYDSRRGGDETSQWEYWAARLEPRLVFSNCGIYGQRTDEIMARLDDCARGADMLLVQGGINDIAQGRPVEDAARQSAHDGSAWQGARAARRHHRRAAVEQRLAGGGTEDPAAERADRRARAGRERSAAPVPRHARGSRSPGTHARRVDLGRRPSVRRGLPQAR